jgi:hypothetical protein
MELIVVFSVLLSQVFFVNLLKVSKVVFTLLAGTFMNDKEFPMLLGGQSVCAVRAAQSELFIEAVVFDRKSYITDFAEQLIL